MTAKIRTKTPHHEELTPSMNITNRIIPYIAVLIITPDMILEMWLGACGCAYGSQMCKGTMPALVPNPIKSNKKTMFLVSTGINKQALFMAEKSNECAYLNIVINATIKNAVPI